MQKLHRITREHVERLMELMSPGPKKVLDYSKGGIPKDYHCRKCKASGCRLWTPYTVPPDSLCAKCAAEKQGISDTSINITTDGKLGSWVPSIPHEDKPAVDWCFEHIPQEGMNWWLRLPINPK